MRDNQNDPIFLIDAKYLCYRSVYALMKTSISNIESNIMYGFMHTIISLAKGIKHGKELIKPHSIILCFDSKHSLRKLAFPDYKKKDKITDKQLMILEKVSEIVPVLRQWMQRIGFPVSFYPGYEADDIFAGYTTQFPNDKFIIVTVDEDIYQLLSEKVDIYLLKKKPCIYTREDFIKEYGIPPDKWSCIKAIGGCRSDKIPGILGIGEKRALDIIKKSIKEDHWPLSTVEIQLGDRYKEAIFYYTLVKLPYLGKKFDLKIEKPQISFDLLTKFFQIYAMRSFIGDIGNIHQAFSFLDT